MSKGFCYSCSFIFYELNFHTLQKIISKNSKAMIELKINHFTQKGHFMQRQDENLAFMLRYENIAWYEEGLVKILDRRIYPAKTEFVICKSYQEVAKAIKDMVTQSAGPYTAAPMGMALAAYECKDLKKEAIDEEMADYFARYMKCPIPYLVVQNITYWKEISREFGVSKTAAINVSTNVLNRKKRYGQAIFASEVPLLETILGSDFDIHNFDIVK